jgi:hypothetical protein
MQDKKAKYFVFFVKISCIYLFQGLEYLLRLNWVFYGAARPVAQGKIMELGNFRKARYGWDKIIGNGGNFHTRFGNNLFGAGHIYR